MSGIIIATVVLAVIGVVVGVALVSVGRKFHVDTDPRVTEVRDCLRVTTAARAAMPAATRWRRRSPQARHR